MAFWDNIRKPYRIEITPTDDHWEEGWNGYVRTEGTQYVIRINKNLPKEIQKQVLKHELGHVYCNHLVTWWIDSDKAEQEARDYADKMTDETLSKLMNRAIRIDVL